MTDYKRLCAELVEKIEYTWGSGIPADVRELLKRARAALAKPEPEGPTDEELRQLRRNHEWPVVDSLLFVIARAVLARWGNRQGSLDSSPPANSEVTELTGKLVEAANGAAAMGWDQHAQHILRAAELLQRQYPQPVPVSERLPGPEDCDAEGRCWVWWKNGVRWVLDEWTHHELREGLLSDYVSHWLPAHAISIPTAND